MSDNIIKAPSIYTKNDVRKDFGADGNDQRAIWHYGDYYIWFLHLSKQRPTGGWISTADNGRINIWYQDANNAMIIEMALKDVPIKKTDGKLLLVFASNDEKSEYEFKGVFKPYDTDDGVIDHVCKRVSKGFDVDEMIPV
ncbi:hypothetical protein [Butyrivibrio sp. NC2007]|jgi:hypothetical protein|uniref:hypothetical protein n=1 Tax=Butyrivibrio sp. NC2007 TaxID=1280683 RepID=UPI0003B60968|nr:hypothetical protein [Butyrivibrio sp. NC2007]